jgi:hypothetical protein
LGYKKWQSPEYYWLIFGLPLFINVLNVIFKSAGWTFSILWNKKCTVSSRSRADKTGDSGKSEFSSLVSDPISNSYFRGGQK